MIPNTDPTRLFWAAVAVLAWLGLCLLIALSRRRRRSVGAGETGEPVLVAFASQTGFAEELAGRTAAAFRAGGFRPRILPLGEVTAADLKSAGRAVFIAATTGEGDAPDSAQRFVRRIMGGDGVDLASLSYAVFALGDESYARYCAFGRSLDGWLHARGARRLFDRVEANGVDPAAMRHWQHHINDLTGATALPDWAPADYGRWRLASRVHLNPGSPGGAIHDLSLEPLEGAADWAAGDIVEIGPRNAPAEVARFILALGLAEDLAAPLADRLLPRDAPGLEAMKGLDREVLLAALPTLPHREYFHRLGSFRRRVAAADPAGGASGRRAGAGVRLAVPSRPGRRRDRPAHPPQQRFPWTGRRPADDSHRRGNGDRRSARPSSRTRAAGGAARLATLWRTQRGP